MGQPVRTLVQLPVRQRHRLEDQRRRVWRTLYLLLDKLVQRALARVFHHLAARCRLHQLPFFRRQ